MAGWTSRRSAFRLVRDLVAVVVLAVVLPGGCSGDASAPSSDAAPSSAGGAAAPPRFAMPPLPGPSVPEPQPASGGYRIMRTSPESGTVGSTFTVSAEGLPPGREADFVWATVNGDYDLTEGKDGRVQYRGRLFIAEQVSLGKVRIGEDGRATATVRVPEDYGELHDTYLVVDGMAVAKGGFRLLRSFTMTPSDGPVGSLITLKVTGLGWKALDSTVALRYDNRYTGFISATTTRGTAVVQFRAAGPLGEHFISVDAASHALPFLNPATGASSTRHLLPFEATFRVTGDRGAPETTIEYPPDEVVADYTAMARVPTVGSLIASANTKVRLSPASGPVGSRSEVTVTGLSPGDADIVWTTTFASELMPSVDERPLAHARVAADGSLRATVDVPNGLGGWHTVRVFQDGRPVAEAPFFLAPGLVGVSSRRVRAGEKVIVTVSGGGWTDLDNGVAVTYDNSYVGYVCGFANSGEMPIEIVATGGPGTHLIDIYPYIFDGGSGEWPWQLNLPQLSALYDHPGLRLGYRLPIIRLAIEVLD